MFLNMFMKICTEETHQIITNAEHAYEDGEITKEQRDEVIKACIQAETERMILANS